MPESPYIDTWYDIYRNLSKEYSCSNVILSAKTFREPWIPIPNLHDHDLMVMGGGEPYYISSGV